MWGCNKHLMRKKRADFTLCEENVLKLSGTTRFLSLRTYIQTTKAEDIFGESVLVVAWILFYSGMAAGVMQRRGEVGRGWLPGCSMDAGV